MNFSVPACETGTAGHFGHANTVGRFRGERVHQTRPVRPWHTVPELLTDLAPFAPMTPLSSRPP